MNTKIYYCDASELLSAAPLVKKGFIEAAAIRISPERMTHILMARSDNDRIRSIAATLLLQRFINDMTGISNSPAAFSYTSYGKPSLPEYPDIAFSLSHSGSYIVCAASMEKISIGIDVQEDCSKTKYESLSKRFFTPSEQKIIFSNEESLVREQTFFKIWSAKEAYIKMLGIGLSCSLNSFNADISSGTVSSPDGKEIEAYIYDIPLSSRYFATVCTNQDIHGVHDILQLPIGFL